MVAERIVSRSGPPSSLPEPNDAGWWTPARPVGERPARLGVQVGSPVTSYRPSIALKPVPVSPQPQPQPQPPQATSSDDTKRKLDLILQHVVALDGAIERRLAGAEARQTERLEAVRLELGESQNKLEARVSRSELSLERVSSALGRLADDISVRFDAQGEQLGQSLSRLQQRLGALESYAHQREQEIERKVAAALGESEQNSRASVNQALADFERFLNGAAPAGQSVEASAPQQPAAPAETVSQAVWTSGVVGSHAGEFPTLSESRPLRGAVAESGLRDFDGLKRALDGLGGQVPVSQPGTERFGGSVQSSSPLDDELRSASPPYLSLRADEEDRKQGGSEPGRSPAATWLIASSAAVLSLGVVGVGLWNNSSQAQSKPLVGTSGEGALREVSAGLPAAPSEIDTSLSLGMDVATVGPRLEVPASDQLASAPASPAMPTIRSQSRSVARAERNPVSAARQELLRGAQSGRAVAMHNLAIDLLNGEHGPPDQKGAIAWFKRAADRGLTDSKYNLGALYERGVGVPENKAEALHWYKQAAAEGDPEASLRVAQLSKAPDAPRVSSQAVEAAPAVSSGPDPKVLETQKLLARAGYYLGPLDGRDTPSLRSALATFQKETDMTGRSEAMSLWPQ